LKFAVKTKSQIAASSNQKIAKNPANLQTLRAKAILISPPPLRPTSIVTFPMPKGTKIDFMFRLLLVPRKNAEWKKKDSRLFATIVRE
jgi:hypothetical protein